MASFSDSVDSALGQVNTGAATGNVTAKASTVIPKVASSVYETGPKDDLIAVDIYGKKPLTFINDLSAGAKGALDSFFGSMKITGMAKETINSALTSANSTLGAVVDAKKQIESYTGINLNALGDLKNQVSNVAITTIANTMGIDPTSMYYDGQSIVRVGDDIKQGGVNGIFNAINRITGIDAFKNVIDLQAESALLGALMSQAGSLGMTSAFDELWDRVNKNDSFYGDNIAYRSGVDALNSVVSRGDLPMLETLVDKMGGGVLTSSWPNLLREFLANYTLPYDTTPGQYATEYQNFIRVFDKVQPGWRQKEGNGGVLYNLDPFLRVSTSTQKVFESATDPGLRASVRIANSYSPQSAVELMKSFYPYTAVV